MFENKKIVILGMARSGYEAAKVLIERGNEVILNDAKEEDKHDAEQIKELTDLGVKLVFGSHPDDLIDESVDYLIKNPGVPIDHKYVLKAKELGKEVINEVELAYRLMPKGAKIVAITGTNGKTTTTTITYNFLHDYLGDRVLLAGNIGFPLCSILKDLNEDNIIVMEFSCQQGENIKEFKPNIGLFTNLSSTHIDFMKTYEHYKETKYKMFFNQSEEDIAIINMDAEEVVRDLESIKSQTKYFSSTNEINGCYLKDDGIYYYGDKVLDYTDILISGTHNLENIMGAIMIAKEFDIPNESLKKTISTFKGVEHCLEYVDEVKGIRFYNDTKATNIKSTQIALSAFKEPTIVILGGMERGQNFDDLKDYVGNVASIIAIGECRERVVEFAEKNSIPVFPYETLKEGFKKCVEEAKEKGIKIILLSPASASWDQYAKFEDRGDEFKALIEEYKNEN